MRVAGEGAVVTCALDVADFGRRWSAFAGTRSLVVAQRGHFDVQVDTIEQPSEMRRERSRAPVETGARMV